MFMSYIYPIGLYMNFSSCHIGLQALYVVSMVSGERDPSN